MNQKLQKVATWINTAHTANKEKQFDRAAKLCKRALKLSPNIPEAWYNLGIALRGLDHRQGAMDALNHALYLTMESADAQNSIGLEFLYLGVKDEAEKCFRRAIHLAPNYANAYSNLGKVLRDQKHLDEAEKCYCKALEIAPNLAPVYVNLSGVLKEQKRFKEAESACLKAIELKPDYAEAYTNRGNVLQELGQLEDAITNYDKVIELKPDYAEPYNTRGNALYKLGQLKEAVESYEKAIELKPDYAEAHRTLSTLKNYKPNDPQIELMESLFTDSEPGKSDRMYLCFALAKVYEDLGEYDKSFNYLDEGNHLRRKELNYKIDNDRRMFSKIREIFTAGSLTLEVAPDGNESIQPLFIVGMPRSGTSLVEQILASHTKVHGAGELKTMSRLVAPILNLNTSQDKSQLSQNEINSIHDGYLEALAALNVPEKIITDKMPFNFQWVGFILSAFPKAKIINLNRDSRATCWSIYKHYFSSKGDGYAYDMDDLVVFYKLYIDLMSFWRERYPNSIYDLCYEDLTENQDQETRRLLEFCNLEWEEQCLYFHKTKRAVKTASAAQVRKKMYKGSSEAWRKYEEHLQPLINGLGY